MVAAVDKAKDVATEAQRRPGVAHVLRMVQHYGSSQGNLHAGAVSYFAFLSFFPLLALTFFAVGVISQVYPDIDGQVRRGVEELFPGLVGGGEGQISLDQVQDFSGIVGALGLIGVLYTGLGFVQVLREALTATFAQSLPTVSFVKVKLMDLLGLVTVGGTLLLSVVVGSGVTRFSSGLLELLGLGEELRLVLVALGVLVALAINTVLFFVMFKQLARAVVPARSLWSGAVLGAVGFELIKQLSAQVISLTKGNPAFQAFGIALTLIVVFNYFARLTLYSASWAYTTRAAMAVRPVDGVPVQGPQAPSLAQWSAAREPAAAPTLVRRAAGPFAAGGAAMLGLVAVVRRFVR